MSCYRPLVAYRERKGGSVVFGSDRKGTGDFMELPCGKCLGCREDRARMWAIRIMHEAQLYDSNLVGTFTYSDQNLPGDYGLRYRDFQLFMKRLRFELCGVSAGPDGSYPVRFFCAGEYGGVTERPHYHAILFNLRLPDQQVMYNGKLHSTVMERLWGNGHVVLDRLSPRAASYVAGYTMGKLEGPKTVWKYAKRRGHYEDVVDSKTGEILSRPRESVVMSRRPGIGSWWYARFGSDVFPADMAVMDGKKWKAPRYYWEKFKAASDPKIVEEIENARYLRAADHRCESTPDRRVVREEVARARRINQSPRGL